MIAVCYTIYFAIGGLMIIGRLFPEKRTLTRVWLGLCLGVISEMWLPVLAAWLFRFSVMAHIAAALAYLVPVVLICRQKRPADVVPAKENDRKFVRFFWLLLIPFTLFSGYLQWTHMLMPAADGSYWCGQSTYGDLCMHLSFMTSLKDARFPPAYNLLYGTGLAYPYLTDSLSTTFWLLGMPVNLALAVPGTYLMFLTYAGFILLGRRILGNRPYTITAAFLFFFLNGGLGFLYDFDLAFRDNFQRILEIFTGYYKTPANQPELNLRFSNVIADLMIPQRSLLGGWAMGIPCFYLLETLFHPEKHGREESPRGLILLGIWAGMLPLIHTHTFLALGLSSLGVMIHDLIHAGKNGRNRRSEILIRYLIYGSVAAVIALPQLIGFTFAQTFQQGQNHPAFLTFQFNWVNNPSGQGMRDFYLWFYVKNIGLPFLMLLAALADPDPKQRRLFSGLIPIVLAAELIRFQPNEYDNNKLFYLAWMIGCMIVSNWSAKVWRMLKDLKGRSVLAAAAAVVVFLSAFLTIARECVSDYRAFSRDAVEAGMFIREETGDDAVFLTGTQHLNPVDSIAGRTIVCGPDLWLYWHGFDTQERKTDLFRFYESPEENEDVLEKYGVDYIYVSSYERSSYEVDEAALNRKYEILFENGEATLYKTNRQ